MNSAPVPAIVRLLALVAALAGGIAIVIEFGVQEARQPSAGAAIWQLARYYTYWTNTAIVIVMAGTALGLRQFRLAQIWLSITASIVLVGLVFYALIYNPDADFAPRQELAEHLLHGVVPVLTLILFLLLPHGRLHFRDFGWGVGPVVVYGAYLLTRGAIDGTYPYWFTDVPKLGLIGSIKSAVMLFSAFAVSTLVFIGLDKAIGHFRRGSSRG